ncbi:MAG TPA: nuclear transport factor 2 family protein [Acidimicrobiales bacterium]|nr:nuclear transport factor 2 family protein [Acidimicrobiales bacterium]
MVTVDELAVEVAALQKRVAASESVLALQGLKARYGGLVDQRFSAGAVVDATTLASVADAVAALFAPDGVWDGGPGLGTALGRSAIAARLRDPTLTFSRHFFLNPRIDVAIDGDTATGRWDLLSPCRRADGTSYWMCGYEDDEYVRTDEGWLHRSMTLTTVFMAPVGEGWTRVFV